MSPLAHYLNELAVSLGREQLHPAQLAKDALIRARRRLKEIQQRRMVVLWDERASSEPPADEIAVQIEKDLAFAMAQIGALELKMDFARMARVRAQDYKSFTQDGTYACPQCWVKEDVTTAIDSLLMTPCDGSRIQTYECPVCGYRFTIDYTWLVQAYWPISQNLQL